MTSKAKDKWKKLFRIKKSNLRKVDYHKFEIKVLTMVAPECRKCNRVKPCVSCELMQKAVP